VDSVTYATNRSRHQFSVVGFGKCVVVWQSMAAREQNGQTQSDSLDAHIGMLGYWVVVKKASRVTEYKVVF